MKRIISTSLLLFIVFPLFGKTRKYAWDEFYLKGKVKTWEKKYYEIDSKAQKKQLQYKKIYTYNKNGLLTTVEHFGHDMTMIKKTEYTYNQQNQVTAITEHEKEQVIKKIIPSYDKKNNSISLYTLKQNEKQEQKILKYKYTYNASGHLIEKVIYNHDGTLYATTREKYNARHDYIGHSLLNSDGSIIQQAMYSYDEKGNILELEEYGPDKRLRGVFTFNHMFDKQGNAVKTYTYQKMQKNKKIIKKLCAFSENHYTYW